MSFSNVFKANSNVTKTENGAPCYSTTGNLVLNLFARVGSLRNASEDEINTLYLDARNYDKELADNIILYARNIREGGTGERRTPRVMLKTLGQLDPAKVRRNLETIVSTGRWDDLFVFEDTPLEKDVMDFMATQLVKDIEDMKAGKTISLLAKWLPSVNTSSKKSCARGKKFAKHFGLTEREYRKTLSALRGYIDVVEQKMSAKDFGSINYEAVPSVAMTRYRHAFNTRDGKRYQSYLSSVEKGEAKINSGVSYPYELIRPYTTCWGRCPVDRTLENQWKSLPDFVEEGKNAIVIADVSGSMMTDNYKPISTSVSLGIYFAEHNVGPYANLFMSFTDVPSLYELDPNATLLSRAKQVFSHCGYNTNLDLAFRKIYDLAVKAGEAPDALIVISDSEIDNYAYNLKRQGTSFEDISQKWQRIYEQVGLRAPKLILWNVESRGNRFLAKSTDPNVAFISGSSAATFKELGTLIDNDAVTAMTEILSRPQYQWK